MNFLEPGCLFIIVRKLTMKIIEKVINAYLQNDAYWLKLDNFSTNIDNDMFNRLQKDQDKESDLEKESSFSLY